MTIQYPKAVCKLYRYRPASSKDKINCIIDEIKNGEIYLANPTEFNDPFETQYVKQDYGNEICSYRRMASAAAKLVNKPYVYSVILEKIIDKYTDIKYITIDEFIKLSFSIVKKAGIKMKIEDYKNAITSMVRNQIKPAKINNLYVASFSEDSNSIPMWAYYADSHKGVCLEYDMTSIDVTNNSVLDNLYKVSYSINVPKNQYNQDYSPLIKGIQWAHENEWRYIYSKKDSNIIEKDGNKYLKMPYLSKIIIGCNAEPELQNSILSAVIKKKKIGSICVTMMKPKYNKYELIEELIFGPPENKD